MAISEGRGVSYSWVVRYCLFRLISRRDPVAFFAGAGSEGAKGGVITATNRRAYCQKFAGAFHRHKLCLYGEDEATIRVVACQLGVTMTHLVRFCLEYGLEALERYDAFGGGRFHAAAFYWLGIKRVRGVEFPIRNSQFAAILLKRYPKSSFW